jgi:hypothetical protein
VNVSQQLGGALGLAVLVTAFDAVTGHAQLGARHLTNAASVSHANTILVHGLDDIFALGALFSVAALAMVALGVRTARQSAPATTAAVEETEGSDEAVPWLEQEAG